MRGTHRNADPTRRAALGLAAGAGFAALRPADASAKEVVRIGLPTKTFWPTTVTEAAVRNGLFEKEGIAADVTIYRGGAEAFEALAADAADFVPCPPSIVAIGRIKGVATKLVAGAQNRSLGWQLVVKSTSPITTVAELAGKKVGITSVGSGSDVLALWTMQDSKIEFTRVPLGGGGLVPNLRAGNVDAVVLYSPLVFEELLAKRARTLVDYATAQPAALVGAWAVKDSLIATNPGLVQRSLNGVFGGLAHLQKNRDEAISLLAEIDDLKPEVAALEYEGTILKLSTDGAIDMRELAFGLELARLSGVTEMAPAEAIVGPGFKPVPTV